MASASMKLLLMIGILAASVGNSNGDGKIAIYWGQNVENEKHIQEVSLLETCETGTFSYVVIAFLDVFGDGKDPQFDLSNHCPTSTSCPDLAPQIARCKELGVKLLLSLGGGGSGFNITSVADARSVADYLWWSFLAGDPFVGPFGPAVLDGIDFAMVGAGTTTYYRHFARYLKDYATEDHPVLLTAAPQCIYPDYWLGSAISTGLFDIVWPQFYDNSPCHYPNMAGLKEYWKGWTTEVVTPTFFLGLPAAPEAAPSGGYIPPENLISDVLPIVSGLPKYGGILLLNKYYDQLNGNYSDHIKLFAREFNSLLSNVIGSADLPK
ncbi:Endochitinase 3 [Nymphaea thermarum]|nr:Endochitinase 3 [Nymphaea thermarum]